MASSWDDYLAQQEGRAEGQVPQDAGGKWDEDREKLGLGKKESSVSLGGKSSSVDIDKDVALVSALVNGGEFINEFLRTLLAISLEQSEENFSSLDFSSMSIGTSSNLGQGVPAVVETGRTSLETKKKVLAERKKDFCRWVDYLNSLRDILDKKKE